MIDVTCSYAAVLARQRVQPPTEAARRRVRAEAGFLIGSWSCSGVMLDAAGKSAPVTDAPLRCDWSIDGHWLRLRCRETIDYWTFDERAQALLRFGFGAGRTGFVGRSPGWQHAALTWTGCWVGLGREHPARDTLRRKGERVAIETELKLQAGWTRVAELDCRRVDGAT